MDIDINTKGLKSIIEHNVDVAVMLATSQVAEVNVEKYSELTGIPIEQVKYYYALFYLVAKH